MRHAAFRGGAKVVAGRGGGGDSRTLGADGGPGWTAATVTPLADGDAAPAPEATLATLARATDVVAGPLALPRLLQAMAPLNEGAGRRWYRRHAAERRQLCQGLPD